ncbi:MAG: hypothetical protein MUO76_05180 [Anaerolineaceae bacterium]|nr:hypothetical protein [Anaerolineaceae bacterium]
MDPILIFAGAGLFGGIFIGAVLTFLIMRTTRKEPEPTEPDREVNPVGFREGYQPTVSLWLNRKTGKLAIDISGKMVADPHKFSQKMRRGMLKLAKEWQHWLNIPGDLEMPAPIKQTPPVEQPREPQTVPVREPIKPKPAHEQIETHQIIRPQETSASRTFTTPQPIPEKIKPPSILSSLVGAARSSEDDLIPAKSMVDQIDGILQEMMIDTSFAKRGIRVVEDPVKGVIVWVGLDQYEGIGAVPDPDILAMLRSAVERWEQKVARDLKRF